MTKRFTILEKIIASIFILSGVLMFYTSWDYFVYLLNWTKEYMPLKKYEISYYKVFKNYHLSFLLPLASIFAGILLLLSKKAGWVISVIVLLINCDTGIYLLYKMGCLKAPDTTSLVIVITMLVIIVLLLIVLMLKPFRLKYKPTKQIFLIVAITTGIIILDRLFLAK
jgi:hypothetical protein